MLTQAELKSFLHYEAETGLFTWLKNNKNSLVKGCVAGHTRKDKRVLIRINSKSYYAHRLIWLYIYGNFPNLQIDHIDRNPSNNKLINLREATNQQNNFNKSYTNRSILKTKGVSKKGRKYYAAIKVDGKHIRSPGFKTIEEASKFYENICFEHQRNFFYKLSQP